jgi:DNA-binding beta-propeller fold protein YncE
MSPHEFSYIKSLSGRGGPQGQVAFALALDQQGNVLVGGRDAAFLTKLDSTGQKILYRSFLGNVAGDSVDALAPSADGSVYVGGSNSAGGFLARLDHEGDTMWHRTLSEPATAIAVDSKGSVYYASAGTIAKLDAFSVAAPGSVSSLALSSDGTVWAAGDGYVARLDSTHEGWDAILPLPKTSIRALALDAAGTPFIAAVAGSKAFIARVQTDASGLAWRTELAASQMPNALAIAPDRTLLVSGNGPAHGFLTVVDNAGRIVENSEVGDSPRDRLNAVAADAQGHTWVAGSTGSDVPDVLLARAESLSASIANHLKAARLSGGTTVAPFATASTSPRDTTAGITLGTTSLTVGIGPGTGTLVIGTSAAWTASSTAPWLHLPVSSGSAGGFFQFVYDGFSGATRTGTISFDGGQAELTVTQAGESYVPASDLTALVSSGITRPLGVAVDTAGNVYFTGGQFGQGNVIDKWTAATGQVTTLVSLRPNSEPSALAVDQVGNLYIGDTGNLAVEKWTAANGQVTTLVSPAWADGVAVDPIGNVYFSNAAGVASSINAIQKWTAATGQVTTLTPTGTISPLGVALDRAGNVYFTTSAGNLNHNDTVEKWTAATGQVTTLVSGLSLPIGVAVDRVGNVYFTNGASEGLQDTIQKWIAATGQRVTLVSSGLNAPFGLAIDTSGNLYIADSADDVVKKWTAATRELMALGSSVLETPNGVAVDMAGDVYIADGVERAIKKWTASTGQVTTLVPGVSPDYPFGVAVDRAGNVYFTDLNNNLVKKWTAATGAITTLVSSGLSNPRGVAVDIAGNVYVSDNNSVKKRIASTGQVNTVVSSGADGVAVDVAGNVYFTDSVHNAVKKWQAVTGQITTLFSSGLNDPEGIAVDGAGNVYVADHFNNAVKKWTAATGQVTTPIPSGLSYPYGVAVDATGNNVYVADTYNIAIKKLTEAFVGPPAVTEPLTAGLDQLLPVVPVGTVLDAVSYQPWLAITSQTNGMVSFSFSATTTSRTAPITVLGQTIAVTQVSKEVPSVVSWWVLWGSQSYPFAGVCCVGHADLPWKISGIRVLFSKPIAVGDTSSLTGVTTISLSGLGTNTLTWSTDPISIGSFSLTLAESGSHALKDADGNPLTGQASQLLSVLLGDFNVDGVVNAADLTGVNLARSGFYNVFADLDGNHVVDAADVQIVRNQIGKTLP